MRPRNKYPNGTVNTEIPQKNLAAKNTIFPPNSQSAKVGQGYETGSYYTNSSMSTSGSAGVGTTTGSYLTSGTTNGITNENFIKGDPYSSKTSTNQALSSRGTTSTLESGIAYQSKIAALKK